MKIEFHDQLPEWITSSDTGAYHPYSKTIFIRKGMGWDTPRVVAHELVHWLIDLFHLPELWQHRWDDFSRWRKGIK